MSESDDVVLGIINVENLDSMVEMTLVYYSNFLEV